MSIKDITLETLIAKYTENLADQKAASDKNLDKLNKRVEEARDLTEKKRLQELVQLQADYRLGLNLVDPIAEATKSWNSKKDLEISK
jgi:lipoate synthase